MFFRFVAAFIAVLTAVAAQDLTAQGILHDIQSAASCSACQTLIVLLKALATSGDSNFVSTITEICILAKVEDEDVCQGVIAQQGPILAHDLRGMIPGSHSSIVLCASFFGLCPYPAPRDYTVKFPSAKPDTSTPAPSGGQPLKFVHFSDIHVDLSYEVGANYNCTKPICCRPFTPADAPGNTSYPAEMYGNTNCDSPVSLEQSMYAAIRSTVPDAAFVIFTGDLVEGAVWLVTEAENTADIHDAYENQMASYFSLVYGTAGNHEAAPVNSYPPQSIVGASSQWVYDALASAWQTWIGTTTANNYGAYAKDCSDKLKIISLNSNLYYNKNFWLFEPTIQYDPDGQLDWLVQQLQAAETAQQRVYIIAHMPMGSSSALYDGSHYFNQIVNRYSATIAAMFFGHTHKDEFEISYSNYSDQRADTAVAMSYIAPAMTPKSGNPSFRVYDVDPVTFGILDYTEYIANVSSPTYQHGPQWEKLYSAKEAYGALLGMGEADAELTPAFWHNVTELFERDDAVFQQYFSRKTGGHGSATCDAACKTSEVCQLRAGEAQYNCVVLKPGLNFKKRDVMVSHRHDDCDASLSADVFAAVLGDPNLLAQTVSLIKRAV
ncbi:hypothetical protein AMS68_006986 [Peltaster fructicola]|uniref:Sphingomyelin phosphodiesterase n=1 Tax=Peltaster fructicola TaxID=286661 RepID=A0A6H0Y3P3_9PEZI|nr:hypothetical protein AMS68_006986 [Peltaster fructicola]